MQSRQFRGGPRQASAGNSTYCGRGHIGANEEDEIERQCCYFYAICYDNACDNFHDVQHDSRDDSSARGRGHYGGGQGNQA
jgi:hypothetical protein